MSPKDGQRKLNPAGGSGGQTGDDERFLSSFGEYVDVLVEESCRALEGEGPLPGEKFHRAGRKLVEDSIGLPITGDVEALVEEVDDLAASGMLAPEKGRVRPTPSGKSIYGALKTLDGLEKYFGGMGITIYSGVDDVKDRKIMDICVGEAERLRPPGGPDVVVFTKTLVERTSDRIQSGITDSSTGVTTDWTTYDKIYYPLEPKLERGREFWRRLGEGRASKIEGLAWSRFLSESDDNGDIFAKKYAKEYIADTHLHEVYHARISGRGNYRGPAEEAAAQLYSVSRGENPFGSLIDLYSWEDDDFPLNDCRKAAKFAFKYLKKAGYRKSSWKKLGPDDPGLDAAVLALREQADKALSMLERDRKMRDHDELERKLGLAKNYAKMNLELERIILAK